MSQKSSDNNWSELLSAIAEKRDQTAFRRIFFFFFDDLLFFSKSITDNHEVSEDIISEIMIKLWTHTAQITQITNLKTYLFRAVKNQSLNFLDHQKVRSIYLDTPPAQNTPSTPEEVLISKEFQLRFDAILAELSPKTKMAFTLVKDNALTYREAAAIMDVSVNTIDRHIQIALSHIKTKIKNTN